MRSVIFSLTLAALALATGVRAVPPANDLCETAIPLAVPGTVFGSTIEATAEIVGTCTTTVVATGVWYRVIGTGNRMTVSTCGGGTNFDTQLTVFCADCDSIPCVVHNDDSCGVQSTVGWCSGPGNSYLILVHGSSGETGDFELSISDYGIPCPFPWCGPPTYNIAELYAGRDSLIGQFLGVLAYTTDTTAGYLVDNFEKYFLQQPMPPHSMLHLTPNILSETNDHSSWTLLYGVLGEDPLRPAERNLTLQTRTDTVLATMPEDTFIYASAETTPVPECDSCKFAVLISGGKNKDENKAQYWEELVGFYRYYKADSPSPDICESNLSVFYFEGTRRNDAIPAARVKRARWDGNDGIQKKFQTIKDAVRTCVENGKSPELYVFVSNHGFSTSHDIVLLDDNGISSVQLKDELQPIVDAGLSLLDVKMSQCFGGDHTDRLRTLRLTDSNCDVRLAATAPHDLSSYGSEGAKMGPWAAAMLRELNAGKNHEEAILAANKAYDAYCQSEADKTQTVINNLDAAIARIRELDPKREHKEIQDKLAEAAAARAEAIVTRNNWRAPIHREQYARSFAFVEAKPKTWPQLQVTPGGKLDLKFTGNKRNTGNVTFYRIEDVNDIAKKGSAWTWNIPESKEFVNGNDIRTFRSRSGDKGMHHVRNDDGVFRVSAVADNRPATLLTDDSSPSNPEEFAGFSMGGLDSSSAEFSALFGSVNTTDSIGLPMTALPGRIGIGGASLLNVTFEIAVQNEYWSEMALTIAALSAAPGMLHVHCDMADIPDQDYFLAGPGIHQIPLGAVSGTGSHLLSLSMTGGYVEFDTWDFGSLVSTVPPCEADLIDYCAQPLPVTSVYHIERTENSCCATNPVPCVYMSGCGGPCNPSGPDLLYQIDLTQSTTLTVSAHGPDNADEQIMLMTDCQDPLGTCAGAADVLAGGPESEQITIAVPAGTYYLSVSMSGSDCGDLTVTIDSDQPLAVELVSFDAVAGDNLVTLRWTTASETDNNRFEIERDGALMARITSQGQGAAQRNYIWEDQQVTNGDHYTYSLFAIDLGGNRQQIAEADAMPTASAAIITEYALYQNFPNPFNPETKIVFDLKDEGFVSLKVFDVLGREVMELTRGVREAGRHRVSFDGSALPAGVYLYRLETAHFTDVKKMLLLK